MCQDTYGTLFFPYTYLRSKFYEQDREMQIRKKRELPSKNATPQGGADQGGLDDIISSIRSGKAFGGTDGAGGGRSRRSGNMSGVESDGVNGGGRGARRW